MTTIAKLRSFGCRLTAAQRNHVVRLLRNYGPTLEQLHDEVELERLADDLTEGCGFLVTVDALKRLRRRYVLASAPHYAPPRLRDLGAPQALRARDRIAAGCAHCGRRRLREDEATFCPADTVLRLHGRDIVVAGGVVLLCGDCVKTLTRETPCRR